MRKEIFLNDQFYHIYNRGVDKRLIFLNERDYERFYSGLCLFNDARQHDYDFSEINLRSLASCPVGEREKLVDILHWSSMPNHFHLFLRQNRKDGIRIFMHKLGTGYTKYFNKKHERSGRLFEGSFKACHVNKDNYFSHLGAYISVNHLDLLKPEWREKGAPRKEIQKCKNFLTEYRWSSSRDYLGKSLIVGVVSPDIYYEITGQSSKLFKILLNQYLKFGLPSEHKAELHIYD